MTGPLLAVRKHRWARQRATPPRVPRGWKIGPPGFIGLGVQKAGTSWWYQLISRHPGVVSRGHPKELHYFGRFEEFDADDANRYQQWFPRRGAALTGEWTPNYIDDPRIPQRAAMSAPGARILVLIRDPVERFRSAIAMLTSVEDTGEELTNETKARIPPNIDLDGRSKGLYVGQLARLLDAFPRDRVLVLQYERCIRDFRSELARTYRFLGLDDGFVPSFSGRRVHVSRPLRLAPEVRADLTEFYEQEVVDLSRSDLGVDVSLWRNFQHLKAH